MSTTNTTPTHYTAMELLSAAIDDADHANATQGTPLGHWVAKARSLRDAPPGPAGDHCLECHGIAAHVVGYASLGKCVDGPGSVDCRRRREREAI